MKGPTQIISNGRKEFSISETEQPGEWFQILAIIISGLTALTCGILFAWSSPAIIKLTQDKENYDITLEEASYVTVIPPIAAVVSSIFFAKMNDAIGRKYTILFMAIPHIGAWILVALAKSIYVFYVSRILAGIADACLFASLPMYIGEISTPKVRGTWGNAMTFLIYLGQFAINVIGGYTSVRETAYICIIIPIIFLCTFPFMPESPYFLIMKKRHDEAKDSLRRLRRIQNVEDEFKTLKADVERQMSESGTWKDLFTIDSNRKAIYSGIFLRASQQMGGISSFAVYTQYIFQQAGGNLDSRTSSIIFTALLVVMNFCASLTLDKLGRKKSYLYSLISCGVVLALEGTYFFLDKEVAGVDVSFMNWLPIVGMVVFVFLYSFGLGIVPTLMLGELFSASIKGKGLCVLNIVFGVLVSTMTKLFQVLETNVGLFCPFYFFAAVCLISAILALYLIPETTGKTLEEIQQSLKSKKQPKNSTSVA